MFSFYTLGCPNEGMNSENLLHTFTFFHLTFSDMNVFCFLTKQVARRTLSWSNFFCCMSYRFKGEKLLMRFVHPQCTSALYVEF